MTQFWVHVLPPALEPPQTTKNTCNLTLLLIPSQHPSILTLIETKRRPLHQIRHFIKQATSSIHFTLPVCLLFDTDVTD